MTQDQINLIRNGMIHQTLIHLSVPMAVPTPYLAMLSKVISLSIARKKIYHVPGQKYYNQTKNNPDYGERWFCTEQEAIAIGWRKFYE